MGGVVQITTTYTFHAALVDSEGPSMRPISTNNIATEITMVCEMTANNNSAP